MGWVGRGKGDLAVEDEQVYCEEGKRYFRYRERREQGRGDMEASGIWGGAGENGDA